MSIYLQQLVSEWYECRGYFIRRNVWVEADEDGGDSGELDVMAFHPGERKLAHVETSLDAVSWSLREERFRRKFELGKMAIPRLFGDIDRPLEVDQIALLVHASKANHETVGGGRVVIISELLRDIAAHLRTAGASSRVVPERFRCLRTVQFLQAFQIDLHRGVTTTELPLPLQWDPTASR